MKHIRILFALFIAAVFASCNQGGVDNSLNMGVGSSWAWTTPGVGTQFVFSNSLIGGEEQSDTFQIIATGLQEDGRTNVIEYQFRNSSADTGFIQIASNGNFSFGSNEGFFDWTAYPTGSHQNIAYSRALDTVEDGQHIVQSDVGSFVDSENLAIAGLQLATYRVREIMIDSTVDSTGFIQGSIDTTDIWFAPSLFMFVKTLELQVDFAGGKVANFQGEDDLIKYTPR